MDGPNAPNPANPNAQNPVDQNQDQVPAGQVPVPQPVPAQPAPAGVLPVPQIVYQNWIGKKPEFSGKPEEDAESHLLSTRDWMEVHTLNSAYNEKKYAEILLHYRQLFIKDDVFIGERGIFGAEIFLRYR